MCRHKASLPRTPALSRAARLGREGREVPHSQGPPLAARGPQHRPNGGLAAASMCLYDSTAGAQRERRT